MTLLYRKEVISLTATATRRSAIVAVVCLVVAIFAIVPQARGQLAKAVNVVSGKEIVYFNDEVQLDDDDTNNYCFGPDRKAEADKAVKAGTAKTVQEYIATKDGKGDFFESIAVDPALCAAVALHMDEALKLPKTILEDEQNELIGQRADKAHLHFLKDQDYWDRAKELITEYLTSGKREIKHLSS